MRSKSFLIVSITVMLGVVNVGLGSPLIWLPLNPSFGGNPMNGGWMLASAQAQSKHKPKVKAPNAGRDMLQDFTDNLNRQVLYRLSREIADAAFGEQGMDPGHYAIGDFVVDITADMSGIKVEVKDTTTGNQIIVEVPYY